MQRLANGIDVIRESTPISEKAYDTLLRVESDWNNVLSHVAVPEAGHAPTA